MCFVTMCQGACGILRLPEPSFRLFMADFLKYIRWQLELEFPNIFH